MFQTSPIVFISSLHFSPQKGYLIMVYNVLIGKGKKGLSLTLEAEPGSPVYRESVVYRYN